MLLAVGVTWTSGDLVKRRWGNLKQVAQDLTFAVLIAVLFTPLLWALVSLLLTYEGLARPAFLTVAPYGALFAAGLLLIRRGEAYAPREDVVIRPRMTKRLPASFNGEIYRLTVRDHNVDIVTSDGTFTIRSRFTDAIDEMEPMPGHCTHRSHWVTEAAIVGAERAAGKTHLRLKNGDLVPVSRKYRPMLEQAGVL